LPFCEADPFSLGSDRAAAAFGFDAIFGRLVLGEMAVVKRVVAEEGKGVRQADLGERQNVP
jgi:hypothetical protein